MPITILNSIIFVIVGFISVPEKFFQSNENLLKPPTNQNFSEVKNSLLRIYINAGMNKTLYCSCRFDDRKNIDFSNCNYEPRKKNNRSRRIEWEHVMPAFKFAKGLRCWVTPICRRSNGRSFRGRKCCSKISPEFKQMEADMHNLFPAIGEINAARANYPLGEIPGEQRKYGICDIEIKRMTAEPTGKVRGDIARAYFYMSYLYKIPLLKGQEEILRIWHFLDPPDIWEMDRNSLIEQEQGNRNPFIDYPELVERIRDF